MPHTTSADGILREPDNRNAHGHFRKAFCTVIAGKMPHTNPTTSIEHRALTLTVGTPQCGHTAWGKNIPDPKMNP